MLSVLVALPEIDMDDGSLWENSDLSDSYRDETREYVQVCLGLTSDMDHDLTQPTNATIRAFESIGMAIQNAYTYGPISYPSFEARYALKAG